MTIKQATTHLGLPDGQEHRVAYAVRTGIIPAEKIKGVWQIDPADQTSTRIITSQVKGSPLTIKAKKYTVIKLIDENTEHFSTTAGAEQFRQMCREAKV